MSQSQPVFVGIDVAFAKKKLLPICVAKRVKGKLIALPLKVDFRKPPVGKGNRAAIDEQQRILFAKDVLEWLQDLEEAKSLRVERIAIDSPSDYCRPSLSRRKSEQSLDGEKISCFATPTKEAFDRKLDECKTFLDQGGKVSRLPNANQLWMLVGFALFRALGERYECLETFPQAIVWELRCSGKHKSTEEGFTGQLETAAKVMGYDPEEFRRKS